MEILGLFDIPIWILLLLCSLFLIYKYSVYPFYVWKDLGVDGPKPIPFFGHISQVYDSNVGIRRCVDKWQKKYGKAVGIYFMRDPVLMVTDVDMLKEIFVKQFNNFPVRYFFGSNKLNNRIMRKTLFFDTTHNWQRIRRIMTPTFSSGKLKQVTHFINKKSQYLSANIEKHAGKGNCIEAKAFYSAFSLDTIAGLAFGLDIDSQNNFELPFIQYAKRLVTFKMLNKLKMLIGGVFPFIIPLFQVFDIGFFDSQCCNYFEDRLYSMLSKRRNIPESDQPVDYLQFLLNAEVEDDSTVIENKLTSEEIAAQCLLFIIAGYETTSSALQFISYEFARKQDVQQRVWEEIQEIIGDTEEPTYEQIQNLKYTTAVISETLRMYPPIIALTRQADKACTLKGVPIPAKAGIWIPVYNIGRDPANFEDPDVFKPERFLQTEHQGSVLKDISYLPFGFGPRNCIGMRLALMEIKLAIVQLLRTVRIEDATPKDLKMEDFSGLLVPSEPIKLSVQLR